MGKFSDYLVFIDESGDHSLTSINKDYPIFVLACCIIEKQHYSEVLTPLVRNLKIKTFGHDLVILHESDIHRNKGAFASMNKENTQNFINELSNIFSNLSFGLIACDINKYEHIKRYGKTARHLYHYSLEFCLTMLYLYLDDIGQSDATTHVICEARGQFEDNQLELEFRRICDGDNGLKKNLPFDLIINRKSANSEGLQIVDLMARPIGLKLLRPEQANRAYDLLKEKRYTRSTCELTGKMMDFFSPLGRQMDLFSSSEKQKGLPETQ